MWTPRKHRRPGGARASAIGAASATVLAGVCLCGATPVPAPPDTDGGVGPNHVVSLHNAELRITDRAGSELARMPHADFWTNNTSSVQLLRFVGSAQDPRVLYDPYDQRWIMTATGDSLTTNSSLLVAVSQSDDPTGAWLRYQFPASTNAQHLVDNANVGFNAHWIAVHCNLRSVTNLVETHGRLYVFDKQDLYAEGSAPPARFDLSNQEVSMAPAATYDPDAESLYLIHFPPGQLMPRISEISGPVGAEVLNLNIAAASTTADWSALPPGLNGYAPQAGITNTIHTAGERIYSAAYRNGSLWFAHTIYLPGLAPRRSSVQWWQAAPDGGVLQRGRVDDPTGEIFYSAPSLAVNKDNDVLVGFSVFASNRYASAGYAFHAGQAAPSLMQAPYIFKEGEGPYYRPGPSGLNRWSDHSASAVDPVDDITLWTIQEYAMGPSNLWGTWWAQLTPPGYADVGLTLSADAASVREGDLVTYSMLVTNSGSTVATFVRVENPPTDLLSLVSATSSVGSCHISGGALVCELGDLDPGAAATVSVMGIAGGVGVISNTARVYSRETDTHLTDNVATALTCVGYAATPRVWINEFHYDDTNVLDIAEGVEIAGVAGTPLDGLRLLFYDGSNQGVYMSRTLSGIIPHERDGFGAVWFPIPYIQNGAIAPWWIGEPDGIALVPPCEGVLQFISYEGEPFVAGDEQAAGTLSHDIGVYEPASTPVGHSLQLIGTGSSYGDFEWQPPAPASPGLLNAGQSMPPDLDGDGLPSAWEFEHFGNVTNAVPGVDSDGDGYSNLEEYVADTLPTDPNSFPRIAEFHHNPHIRIYFLTSSNRVYDVEALDAVGADDGFNLVTGLPGDGSMMSVEDPAPDAPTRYYRVRVRLP